MKQFMESIAFIKAKHIIEVLMQNGFKAYIAGGAVRDMISGDVPSDFDIVTDADINEIYGIFTSDKVKKIGRSFTICMVDNIEIASCRTEAKNDEQIISGIIKNNCGDNTGNTNHTDHMNHPGHPDNPCHTEQAESTEQAYQTDQPDNAYQTGNADNRGNTNQAYNPDEQDCFFPRADLGKRDFTMNSMAFDPFSNKIIDPFSGEKDLKNKIIRFTGNPKDRIAEDPLRMIRACRFVAKINGKISSSSLKAIKQCKGLVIENIAFERIRLEILKAMEYDRPSLFFYALHRSELLSFIFPCLDRCYDLDGGPHHGETVFDHCMLAGDALSADRPLLRLAGYLHDVGKYDAAEIKNGRLTFQGHEKKTRAVISDLKRLKFSAREIDYIYSMIYVHMRPLADDTSPKAVRKILALLEEKGVSYRDFIRMRIADKKGNRAKSPYTFHDIRVRVTKFTREIYGNKDSAFSIKDLKIKGNDIMEILDIPSGPMVGIILQQIFEKVVDDPHLNNAHDLKKLVVSVQVVAGHHRLLQEIYMSEKREIKLISWNINGLRAVFKKDFVKNIVKLDPDILLLQETKLQEAQRTEEMIYMDSYESFWSYSTIKKGYSGVAAYSKLKPLKVTTFFSKPEFDNEGRIIQLDYNNFILFNIYFPNGQMSEERLQYKLDFYKWFLSYADELRQKEGKGLVITGDFNTAHNEIDLKNPGPNSKRSGFLRVERDILDNMLERGYVDTFRSFFPDKVKYSWWSYRFNARKNNAGWRIDYFFVTEDLIKKNMVKQAFIDNDVYGSDHCPVGIVLEI